MSVLRVVVVRTGGFAGVRRTAEVDDPREAERLADAVRADARREADDPVRDAFVYEVTVVTTTEERTYALPDGAMRPSLRDAVRSLFTR